MLKSFPFRFFKKKNKTAKFKYLEDNQYFQHFFYDSPIAIYSCDKDGHITFFNAAAVELWGREPETDKDLWCGSWKTYYPDGRLMALDERPMAKTLKEGIAYDNEEITIERPDHSLRKLMAYPRPIFDKENKLIGAHNTLIDITEKISFKEKQYILSAIVESSDDAIISKDINGVITSWNSGAKKTFGYTEQEVLGKHITILIPKDRLQEEENILKNIRQGKKVDHYQTIRLHKSGREIPISLTVSPLKDNNNTIIGASKIGRDIANLLQTQQALKHYADNLEVLNSIGKVISEKLDVDVILQQVTNATTKITGAAFGAFLFNTQDDNGEALMLYNLSGLTKEAFEKLGIHKNTDLFRPTFKGKEILRIDDLREDSRYRISKRYRESEGTLLSVASYLAVPLISSSGEVVGGLLFGHPEPGIFKAEHEEILSSISSQAAVALENSRLFEEVKALSEKKDEFIALASHELKTPLTSIKGYLQLLEKKSEKNQNTFFIEKALYQVEKLDMLIADLLNVSKIEAGKLEFNMETFELNTLLREVIDTFLYANKSHEIIYNCPKQAFLVEADKQRIEQVIINLLSNAVKYSPKATKVYISLNDTDQKVTVKVKDEGIGLNDSQKKSLFTKFYRAEAIMNVSGLGLGLYLSKEIINRHNGKMEVISEFGKGSEFSFTLPFKQ